jgi:hypothetical protein
VPFYLWVGRNRWFFHDEWFTLVAVDGGDLDSLLAAPNEHWTTVPKLIYRVLFNLVGLRSYVPYQLVTIAFHVATACLLRVVMRRSGVSGWMATIVAGVFLLLGSGDHNVVRAFQMTFTGAVAFGLAQFVLADHEGRVGGRDLLGVVAGALAVMCSGVGVAMVAATGVATILHRRYRAAMLHVAPLGFLFLWWWWSYGREAPREPRVPAGEIISFGWHMLLEGLNGLTQFTIVAVLVVVVLLGGWVLAVVAARKAGQLERVVLPLALLAGLIVFVGVTSLGRAGLGTNFAAQSRYVWVIVALASPALAVAADAVAHRSTLLAAFVVVILLAGLPSNLDITWNQTGKGRGERNDREIFLAFAQVPAAATAPDWVRPDPATAQFVTLGWLRQVEAEGRLPRLEQLDARLAAEAEFRHAVQLIVRREGREACERLASPTGVRVQPGEWFAFSGVIAIREVNKPRDEQVSLEYPGDRRSALVAMSRPLELSVRAVRGGPGGTICAVQPPAG